MSSLTAYDAMRDWFEANWSFTARRYENEIAYPPDDLAPFVYMEVVGGEFDQKSIGAAVDLWREAGRVILHCCVPTGSGVETARSYAQTLAQMMRGLALAPKLHCADMRITPGEPFAHNGNYFDVRLITSWHRDTPA